MLAAMLSAETRSTIKACLPARQMRLTNAEQPPVEMRLAGIKSQITTIFRNAGAKLMVGLIDYPRKCVTIIRCGTS